MPNSSSPFARIETLPYDVAEQLRTREETAAYLDAWLEDFPDDVTGIARALRDVARSKSLAKKVHKIPSLV